MRLEFGVMGEAGDWFHAGQLTNAQIWGSPGFYPGTTDVHSLCE